MNRARFPKRRGFWLLESLLAVAIFSIGILSLAGAVNNCMVAQKIKQDDVRARIALGNRMAEIEAGVVQVTETKTEDLKGGFEGMKLKQSRKPLKKKDENERDITGLWEVILEVQWRADGQDLTRQLSFYHYPLLLGNP